MLGERVVQRIAVGPRVGTIGRDPVPEETLIGLHLLDEVGKAGRDQLLGQDRLVPEYQERVDRVGVKPSVRKGPVMPSGPFRRYVLDDFLATTQIWPTLGASRHSRGGAGQGQCER